jgi:hypothetical protein
MTHSGGLLTDLSGVLPRGFVDGKRIGLQEARADCLLAFAVHRLVPVHFLDPASAAALVDRSPLGTFVLSMDVEAGDDRVIDSDTEQEVGPLPHHDGVDVLT